MDQPAEADAAAISQDKMSIQSKALKRVARFRMVSRHRPKPPRLETGMRHEKDRMGAVQPSGIDARWVKLDAFNMCWIVVQNQGVAPQIVAQCRIDCFFESR